VRIETTWPEFSKGLDAPTGERHVVVVKANAVVEVTFPSGAPAVNEPVIVRMPDGSEVEKMTNKFGRVLLYHVDADAKFKVSLKRSATEMEAEG